MNPDSVEPETTMKNSAKTCEVDRIVAMIDETRASEHFRSPDRPDSKFVKPRRRQDPAIRRAKTRLRTANYRNRLDKRCAPSTAVIGMALVMALVTSKRSSLTDSDRDLVGRALSDLQERGFDIMEVLDTLQRLRRRVTTVDRIDEDGDNQVV